MSNRFGTQFLQNLNAGLVTSPMIPLSITISPSATSPISSSQTVFWLNAKDTSRAQIEQRCLELEKKIHNLIFDFFSKELTTDLQSPKTP